MSALTPMRSGNAKTAYTGAQLQLIRNTVAKDTNDAEFNLFMAVAQKKMLDPFSKQISAIVFSKGDSEKRQMAIIVTIDGMRAIAARSGRYRPDEDEPEFEYSAEEKGPHNPLGLIKAVVRIYLADTQVVGGWRRATGVAYWDEFAPIKEEAEGGYEWVDTGETWPDTGKPRKRKVPRNAGAEVVRKLDTSGQWGKMPRIMLSKCAEAQALRKAFPEDLSSLYEGAELDRAQIIDVTATEIINEHATENRLKLIGASNGITFQMTATSPLEPVPLGECADRIIAASKDFDLRQLRWFESANLHPMREFWARAKTDALAVKKHLDDLRRKLEDEETRAEADA